MSAATRATSPPREIVDSGETPSPEADRTFRESRIQSALLIVALGMLFFVFVYGFLDRPRFQILQGVTLLGVVAARAWARRPPAPPWSDLPVHAAIASAMSAVIGAALLAGPRGPGFAIYLVLVPAFAACLLPVRATLGWTLAAVGGCIFLDLAPQSFSIEPDGDEAPFERILGQAMLVLMVFGAAYSQWRTTETHVEALRQREAHIREQTRELEQARDAAVRASRVKSEFLATVSHEIRTPMNAVIGLTDLVLETKIDDEQRNLLETSRRSGEALLGILNDILDFSKIESDRIELEDGPLSLRACVEDALEMLSARAVERDVELLHDHPADVAGWIRGDALRLRQVVVNLVSNAIKFTQGGDVTVRVEERGPELRIGVRDTGIGIAIDRRERLFQPFSQVDASTTRRFGGTGLGLAISRRLVERMGGQIGVESEPGSGSEFWFTLPLVVAEPGPGDTRVDPAKLTGRSLLVVHPHAGQRALLERDGTACGMRLCAVGSVAEATAAAAPEPRWDAVLVDSRVLVREGLSATAALLAAAAAPAVLLASPGDLSGADEAGAGAVFTARLARPVRSKRLAETLVSLWLRPTAAAGDAPAASTDRLAERLPLRVLVAEDNLVNQRVVRLMLERLGYAADVVDDGAKAVAAARERAYDLILMDMQMPELDGVDATRAIRERAAEGSRPRIVALTANAMAEDRARCLAAGMDDFLAKPLATRELRRAIERCAAAIDAARARAGESVT